MSMLGRILVLDPTSKKKEVGIPIFKSDSERFAICTSCGKKLAIFESRRCWQCGAVEHEFHFKVFWWRLEQYKGNFNNFCFDEVVFDFKGKEQILRGKTFRGCRFVGSKFYNVDLSGCVFCENVDFTGATFKNCRFQGATFNECVIKYVGFSKTNFAGSRCNFKSVEFDVTSLKRCSLRNAVFDNKCTIKNTEFGHTDFRGANLSAVLISSSLFGRGTILSSCNFGDTKFEKVTIKGEQIKLKNTNLRNAEFIESDLTGCNLVQASVNNLSFDKKTTLDNVVLTESQLEQIDFGRDTRPASLIVKQEKLSLWNKLLLWNVRYSIGRLVASGFNCLILGSLGGLIYCFLSGGFQSELLVRHFFWATAICSTAFLMPVFISITNLQKIHNQRLGKYSEKL